MSRPVKVFMKAPVERKRLYLDYTCWLETVEKLTSFQAFINPSTPAAPLAVTTGYTDATNKKLVFFVSGGVANTDYIIQMVVNTDSGQIKRDDIGISVHS